MRTSTLTSSVPPTRRSSLRSSTRSSFTCIAGETVPSSSRNRVPPAASSKQPFLRWWAPVNAPLLVTEELALEQRVGERAAVDGEERAVAPVGLPMDRGGDEFLARAGLAVDEHGAVGLGDARDQVEQLEHARVAARQVLERVALDDVGDHLVFGRGPRRRIGRGAFARDLGSVGGGLLDEGGEGGEVERAEVGGRNLDATDVGVLGLEHLAEGGRGVAGAVGVEDDGATAHRVRGPRARRRSRAPPGRGSRDGAARCRADPATPPRPTTRTFAPITRILRPLRSRAARESPRRRDSTQPRADGTRSRRSSASRGAIARREARARVRRPMPTSRGDPGPTDRSCDVPAGDGRRSSRRRSRRPTLSRCDRMRRRSR